MLASTMHNSNNKPHHHPRSRHHANHWDKVQALPKPPAHPPDTPHTRTRIRVCDRGRHPPGDGCWCLRHPTVCQPPAHTHLEGGNPLGRVCTRSGASMVPLVNTTITLPTTRRGVGWVCGCVLLRKEVIQPHLPVRLPCYDFVPIANPTFDHSPPHKCGLGHGLRVLPTFVT